MVVGTGRARDLPAIIDALVAQGGGGARTRRWPRCARPSRSPTTSRRRLADALEKATGKKVEVKVIVDPTVLGGLVAQVGDTVIDGSVRTRLEQLKTAL